MRYAVISIILLASLNAGALPPCELAGLPSDPIEFEQAFHIHSDDPSISYTLTASVRGSSTRAQAFLMQKGAQDLTFIAPRTAVDATLELTILGTLADAPETVVCFSRRAILLRGFGRLAIVADRIVVPAAGTTLGANNSSWKTSLQLVGFGTGTIYFRPLGTFHGDASDPHASYDLGQFGIAGIPGVIQVRDIASAMGVTGFGNLDIVPDYVGDPVHDPMRSGFVAPRVVARVWNDSGQGEFGGSLPALTPVVTSRSVLHIVVPSGYPDKVRVNVGIRTFDRPLEMERSVFFRDFDGFGRLDPFPIPANTYIQVSLEELFPDVVSGDYVAIGSGQESNAPMVGYYAVVDNVTNDTQIFTDAEEGWQFPHLRDIVIPDNLF
jgi:hypothetical protein